MAYSNGTVNKKKFDNGATNPDKDDVLLQSFRYICSLPGKKIRSKLIVAVNTWLNVDPSVLEKVCHIVELLHNASLL